MLTAALCLCLLSANNLLLPMTTADTDNLLISLDTPASVSGLPGGVLRSPILPSEPPPVVDYDVGVFTGGACNQAQAPQQKGYGAPARYGAGGGGGFISKLRPRNWFAGRRSR